MLGRAQTVLEFLECMYVVPVSGTDSAVPSPDVISSRNASHF